MNSKSLIEQLKEGNDRFIEGGSNYADYEPKENSTPTAIILSCMDTRVPPEIIFDQGVGKLFVLRVAGNIVTDELVESAVLACRAVNLSDIIVLGHTSCKAIDTAREKVLAKEDPGFLKPIADAISGDEDKLNDDLALTILNTLQSINDLKNHPVLTQYAQNTDVNIHGAVYDVKSGKVEFM